MDCYDSDGPDGYERTVQKIVQLKNLENAKDYLVCNFHKKYDYELDLLLKFVRTFKDKEGKKDLCSFDEDLVREWGYLADGKHVIPAHDDFDDVIVKTPNDVFKWITYRIDTILDEIEPLGALQKAINEKISLSKQNEALKLKNNELEKKNEELEKEIKRSNLWEKVAVIVSTVSVLVTLTLSRCTTKVEIVNNEQLVSLAEALQSQSEPITSTLEQAEVNQTGIPTAELMQK